MNPRNCFRLVPLLLLVIMLAAALPTEAAGDNSPKRVRVGIFGFEGYHELNYAEHLYSGYGYDMLMLMEKYANLNFVLTGYERTWEETQQDLLDGKIDMTSSAAKTEARLEKFDFSLPIGVRTMRINVRPSENRFIPGEFSTYNGMVLGLLEGSSANRRVEEFAKANGFSYQARYYANGQALKQALRNKEVDAVAISSLLRTPHQRTISEFASENIYIIVKKGNKELLKQINYAIMQMDNNHCDWQAKLRHQNYHKAADDEIDFTAEELAFIRRYSEGGKKLVIATDTNWAPFSCRGKDGYNGIMLDLIDYCMKLSGMQYEIYAGSEEICDATPLQNEKVDLYLGYVAEEKSMRESGLLASDSLIDAAASYLVRQDTGEIKKLALVASATYLNRMRKHVAGQTVVEYKDPASACKAVLDGEVDAAYLYNYYAELVVNADKTGMLASKMVPGSDITLVAAMRAGDDHTLMSILQKCLGRITRAEKTMIVAKQVSYDAAEMSLYDYVRMNPLVAGSGVLLLAGLVGLLVVSRHRRLMEERHNEALQAKVDEITVLNDRLKEKQIRLEEASCEQEAQLEEITALNEAMQEKQSRLEEAACEQEAQLEEITALNEAMQEKQIRMEEISCEQESQLNEITALNEKLQERERELQNQTHEKQAQLQEILALNEILEMRGEELEKARKAAEDANDAKSSFLFNMSHDIRTPMNAIIGFTDLAIKHREEPTKQADYLNKISNAGKVLLGLINNVLEMARIEKGTVILEEQPWAVDHGVEVIYSMFQEMMAKKEITFTKAINIKHQNIICDCVKLREIITNLVSNAYKYNKKGGTVHLQLDELPCDKEGHILLQITVRDTGIGMSEEFLPRLFEEFAREHTSTENKVEGTGLGMPIVKRIVELMGGQIRVDSKLGEGTTFVVTIPFCLAVQQDGPKLVHKEQDGGFDGMRLLLAEDNELNMEIATELLQEAGFVIDCAANGRECYEMLEQQPADYYSAVLMDIQMPEMNGYEATTLIRNMDDERKASIPIIAMTANAFSEDKKRAHEVGMDGHVAKPVDVPEIIGELKRVLKQSRAEE